MARVPPNTGVEDWEKDRIMRPGRPPGAWSRSRTPGVPPMSDPLPDSCGCSPNFFDGLLVAAEVAMGKIQARNVHAGFYHPLQNLR